MATVHLLIKGKVQGVFYRASAKKEAERLGLNGWVKNTTDGHVEATVNGEADAVERFIAWCHKGPSEAKVEAVVATPKPDDGFTGFVIMK